MKLNVRPKVYCTQPNSSLFFGETLICSISHPSLSSTKLTMMVLGFFFNLKSEGFYSSSLLATQLTKVVMYLVTETEPDVRGNASYLPQISKRYDN